MIMTSLLFSTCRNYLHHVHVFSMFLLDTAHGCSHAHTYIHIYITSVFPFAKVIVVKAQ
ncbi:hypothetical protein C8Q73DRAFT_712811 [Cubamyces lactineus]|nr:hypothetical protein C8Q73DRAFT_712811 [Cubamyces lactineus]